jgi:hypothetical protein
MNERKMNKKESNVRLSISAGLCVVIGILISLVIKNMRVGLLLGLVIGVLGGSLFSARRR